MTNENKSTIELGKQYQAKCGYKVRIYATDGAGKFPIHGAIDHGDGYWILARWTESGRHYDDDSKLDLIKINPKRKIEFWMCVYPYYYNTHPSYERALLDANADITKCLGILHFTREYEEGEGL